MHEELVSARDGELVRRDYEELKQKKLLEATQYNEKKSSECRDTTAALEEEGETLMMNLSSLSFRIGTPIDISWRNFEESGVWNPWL